MWKTFAGYFGVRTEEPGDKALDLEKMMSDKGPVWDEIVQKHGLQVCCTTASHFERWVHCGNWLNTCEQLRTSLKRV